jgi:hypothetical protein
MSDADAGREEDVGSDRAKPMLRMKTRSLSGFISALAIAMGVLLALPASAITVTGTTSDNGYPAHLVTWTDSSGLPRSAMMVDERSTAPYTGYLRQFKYQINGVTRTCTGSYNYATDGHLEFSGDGFVQNHTAAGADVSTGNGNGTFPGTTTITLQGPSHAIITYNIPTYAISGVTVPTTLQWFFADGRSQPIFAITQDASASPGNLGADSRSPYGDIAYDGATTGDPITGNVVGGYSYGDQYKFVTLAAGPQQVTRASPWKATESNTIPYAMQWVDPGSGVDAEFGHVATLPLSLSDQGIDTQTSIYDDPPDFFDPRTQSYPAGPLPPDNTQAFQIINETATLPASGTTNSKRLTWGAQWGRVGGFNEYGSFTDIKNYSQHSTDPAGQTLVGNRVSGALMAYSVLVVFGPHLGNYETGTVGQEVTQMQNIQLATLTASTGTVAASGPAGVGNASTKTISYTPQGYNPTYACWELSATNNLVNTTLTPARNTSLDHPVFIIDNYTAGQLPALISVGSGLTNSGTDYFVTLDATNKRLWITVNRVATSAVNLVVPLTYTVTLTAGPNGGAIANTFLTVASGGSASFTATPATGYGVNQWLVNGSAVQTGGDTYTLNDVTANAAVQVTFSPLFPVISSTSSETGTEGTAFNYQISASNNPTAFGASGLPPNVAVNSSIGLISGTPETVGTFSVILSASNAYGTGTGTLTLILQSPFPLWQAANFGANAGNPAIAGATAINNQTGIENLLAYSLGLNPFTANVTGLPAGSIAVMSGTSYLTLQFIRNSTAADVTYTVQGNDNLANPSGWAPVATYSAGVWSGSGTVLESGGGSFYIDQVFDAQPVGASTRRVIRLEVSH